MTGAKRSWPVRLAAAAEADFEDSVRWTAERFGEARARTDGETLSSALAALSEGPAMAGVKSREDIAEGMFTLHAARLGRKARHFVLFRIGHDQDREVIEVVRLLHDAMDLAQHAPPS